MTSAPLDRLVGSLAGTGMTRFFRRMFDDYPDLLMKDLTVEAVNPDRTIKLGGRWVTNFGSDSFLGLDQDLRVCAALERGLRTWGTHNGTSRAFSSAEPNVRAEHKLAEWLGTEAALIYPSVTLANVGALPALVTRQDVLVADQFAHNSIDEGLKLAKARGVRTAKFEHNSPAALEETLRGLQPFRHAVVAVDGVYSMSGELPPLQEFDRICRAHNACLYVDDAHASGVLGEHGRGTVLASLGHYDNVLTVGSLSKGFSCLGGFVAGSHAAVDVLKLRSNSLIFGGPVPPPYLEAVCAVVDILMSPEYPALRARLDANVRKLAQGAARRGFTVLGGLVPIVSVLIGGEEATLKAGRFLYEHGYYAQSVVFPAVPHGHGVLRMQVNANHAPAQIDGLLDALAALAVATAVPEPAAVAAA
ncbi:pyridoxal phosphate-dependent aminotransferase family protein [Gemmata sp. JC717]|uniref:aminotransferase class I/II-fold pyridoxal phosphate-dependent enzyme n=1 Tax=Gemmata algarum TaxID=2975278 RepID=UPI0021BA4984|nr:pyridoxal phosphate-dependent aminotransferase family protein [Gemmata algarum]MDY3556463.1 pyridoxal phosphate-dependent aminotransferase family protein [Gemmata algarum]